MSDLLESLLGDVPSERRLEGGAPTGYVGSIHVYETADPRRVELARRTLREIPLDRLERNGRVWIERSSGKEYELVRSHGWPPRARTASCRVTT